MPNGLSGITGNVSGFDLAVATDTLIYTCPTGKRASITVAFVNRGTGTPKVRLARGTGASPASTDYLEYAATVAAGTPLIRSGIALSPGDNIWARSDTGSVITVQAEGVEA